MKRPAHLAPILRPPWGRVWGHFPKVCMVAKGPGRKKFGEAMPCGASGAPVPALIATGPRRSAPSPRDERRALVPGNDAISSPSCPPGHRALVPARINLNPWCHKHITAWSIDVRYFGVR